MAEDNNTRVQAASPTLGGAADFGRKAQAAFVTIGREAAEALPSGRLFLLGRV